MGLLTDTRYGLSLIYDLLTPEVPFPNDEYSHDGRTENENLDGIQKQPNIGVHPVHSSWRSTICALNDLVTIFIPISITEALLPIYLEDFIPHRY